MLQTPKVQAYVQKASLEGKEEKKFVRFTFYITPVNHELAAEVSPAIAGLLFKKDEGGAFHPVLEMDAAQFEIGMIPLQTMELHPVDDPKMDMMGVLLQGVQISNISARKVFPDDPNFTLIFNAELPKNELAVKMMDKYFREKVHLTFAVMQGQLFPDADVNDTINNPQCEYCDDRAIYRDKEKIYYCQKDVRRSSTEVTLLVTKETPAQAEARILAEREAAMKEDGAEVVLPGMEAAVDDTKDTSHANRPRGGKTSRKPKN